MSSYSALTLEDFHKQSKHPRLLEQGLLLWCWQQHIDEHHHFPSADNLRWEIAKAKLRFSWQGPVKNHYIQTITSRPSNLRRWTSSTRHGLSSLQILPNIPHLQFKSEGAWGKGPREELALLVMISPMDISLSRRIPPATASAEFMEVPAFKLPVMDIFWCPSKLLSALQAKARRFTGRSDWIILSIKIAGKVNFGMTFTS